jgi:hypothetical protein
MSSSTQGRHLGLLDPADFAPLERLEIGHALLADAGETELRAVAAEDPRFLHVDDRLQLQRGDRLQDLARRRREGIDELERRLAPNLG